MKKTICILFLAFFGLLASCSEDDITPIQKQCKNIDAQLASYRLKTIDLSGKTEETGTITGYFKNKDLIKATVESANELGRKFDEYYFDGEYLSCVKQIAFIYNKPSYYTREVAAKNGDSVCFDDRKTVEKTNQFFFYEKRMIKWINQDNKTIEDNDRKYQFQKALLQSDADKLQKMLKDQ